MLNERYENLEPWLFVSVKIHDFFMVLVLIAIINLLQRFKGLKEGNKEKEIRKLSNLC